MKKRPIKFLILFVFLLMVQILNAQDMDIIKGQITSKTDKLPLPGVSVFVISNGLKISETISDFDGNYQLKIPDGLTDYKVMCSFIGMKTKEIKVKSTKMKNGNKK